MPAKKKPQTIEEMRRAKRAPTEVVQVALDESTTVEFKFKGMGRRSFELLSDAHASEEDPSGWDMDTFPSALIAASCESPAMTQEEARSLWDDDLWTVHDLDKLFTAALKLSATFRKR